MKPAGLRRALRALPRRGPRRPFWQCPPPLAFAPPQSPSPRSPPPSPTPEATRPDSRVARSRGPGLQARTPRGPLRARQQRPQTLRPSAQPHGPRSGTRASSAVRLSPPEDPRAAGPFVPGEAHGLLRASGPLSPPQSPGLRPLRPSLPGWFPKPTRSLPSDPQPAPPRALGLRPSARRLVRKACGGLGSVDLRHRGSHAPLDLPPDRPSSEVQRPLAAAAASRGPARPMSPPFAGLSPCAWLHPCASSHTPLTPLSHLYPHLSVHCMHVSNVNDSCSPFSLLHPWVPRCGAAMWHLCRGSLLCA